MSRCAATTSPKLQYRLAAHGLSSLGRSEAKVLPALDALIVTLRRILGETASPYPPASLMRAGQADLEAEAQRVFGPPRADAPRARILATLPPEAADDPELIVRLIETGMDCARINCAHDDAAAWGRMIANIRAAEKRLGLSCRVLMDIAGPKCRIAEVSAPPKYRIQRGQRLAILEKLELASRRDAGASRSPFRKSSTNSPSARRCSSTTAKRWRGSSRRPPDALKSRSMPRARRASG